VGPEQDLTVCFQPYARCLPEEPRIFGPNNYEFQLPPISSTPRTTFDLPTRPTSDLYLLFCPISKLVLCMYTPNYPTGESSARTAQYYLGTEYDEIGAGFGVCGTWSNIFSSASLNEIRLDFLVGKDGTGCATEVVGVLVVRRSY
jgi:hypothetical protein